MYVQSKDEVHLFLLQSWLRVFLKGYAIICLEKAFVVGGVQQRSGEKMDIQSVLEEIKLNGKVIPVAGGDVNQTYRIEDDQMSYFLKIHPHMSKEFFEAEVSGLKQLAPYVRVPETFLLGENKEGAYLLMEWIEPGKGDQKDLARQLAKIHQVTGPNFGFYENNYLGTLVQENTFEDSWWPFFFQKRIEPQIALAKEKNLWTAKREAAYGLFQEKVLSRFKGQIEPSLLH